MKVGACARTAAVSGRTSSSRRFAIRAASSRIRQGDQRPNRSQRRRGEGAAKRRGSGDDPLQHRRWCARRRRERAGHSDQPRRRAPDRLVGGRGHGPANRRNLNIVNEETRAKAQNPVSRRCWRRESSSASPITPRSSRATGPSGQSRIAALQSATGAARREERCWYSAT